MHNFLLATGSSLLFVYLALNEIVRRLVETGVLTDKGDPLPRASASSRPNFQVDADFFDVEFPATDGRTKLQGLLIVNRGNPTHKGLMVFVQGCRSTIPTGFETLPDILATGHHSLWFDYGGIGTPGRATFRSICEDAVAAHRYGQKIVSGWLAGHSGMPDDNQTVVPQAASRTALLGYSLGGWPACYASDVVFAQAKIAGGVLALMDTGTDMYEVLCERSPIVRWFIPGLLLRRA